MAKHIVSQKWMMDHLYDPDLVIADCRFDLAKPDLGQEQYEQDHIPGAVYFHLNTDLSGPVTEHGGRHPLPGVAELSAILGQKGIDQSKKVVAYDDQGGAMAARLWFLLKYLGHDEVYVLDQGYQRWKERGFPVSSEIPVTEQITFVPRVRQNMICSMEDVRKRLGSPNAIIIDSRSSDRYRGENETIDPVGGHIPGAWNECWMDSLQDGRWKTKEQLEERLQRYLQNRDKELVLYCGSGVTACANFIAFEEVGLKPRLYAGSWSDWISYKDNPVAKGEEESKE
jgi:thiosulfate/3-mercaptopyruvate sulfurtransferase